MAETKQSSTAVKTTEQTVKKLSTEEIMSNKAVQDITRGAKPYAKEPYGDSSIVFYLLYKDSAPSIFAAYAIDGHLDSESQYILKDPDFESAAPYSPDSKRTLESANIKYTVKFVSDRIKNESSRYKNTDDNKPSIEFLD